MPNPPSETPLRRQQLSRARADELIEGVLEGHIRSGARLMRLLDDRVPGAEYALRQLYPRTGQARTIGITGNPGSGKSTLTDQLIASYRAAGHRVGVVAVDPSSPFTGGAILGDRIRMMRHATDPDVFIHSLATRGQLGGLSRSTDDVVNVLDAMGFDRILIETVGVGQDEIDIVRTAQTSVVVLVPGLGDDIQAIKAGILEIADIFVVNKADREGALRTVNDLRSLQGLIRAGGEWVAPILKTVAVAGDGLDALIETIDSHATHLDTTGSLAARRRSREAHLLRNALRDRLAQRMERVLASSEPGASEGTTFGDRLIDELVARRTDPYTAADEVLAVLLDTAAP